MTAHSEKFPADFCGPNSKIRKSKSSTSVQPAQSKALKSVCTGVCSDNGSQEVQARGLKLSNFFKKFSSSKSQVSRSDEETTRRSGVDHANKNRRDVSQSLGRPPHSTGQEVIVPSVGGIEVRNDESKGECRYDKHVRTKRKERLSR
jgi:hypothetical protein